MRSLLILLSVFLVGCGSNPANKVNKQARTGTGFQKHELTSGTNKGERYSVFVPLNYTPSKSWPAIVFLHGLGEGGDDGVRCTTVGIGPAIARDPAKFDFVVVFPQGDGTWGDEADHRLALDVLDDAARRYTIDTSRVTLTGLSTGGKGTWLMGAKFADRFSALAPMCAHAADDVAPLLVRHPVWAFHNRGDPFVFAAGTSRMVEKIKKAGNPSAKATIYGSVGHNCWDRAYRDSEFLAWVRGAGKKG